MAHTHCILFAATMTGGTPVPALNEREREIVIYKSKGMTSKEIGRLLNLEYRTVETYFYQIKKKLQAKNTAHAIYLACLTLGINS